MNRTIRSNCFETNSSSTHSVTVVNIKANSREGASQLVIDGILYPGNLGTSSAIDSDYNDIECDTEYILTCRTVDEKAALFMQHVKFWRHYETYHRYIIANLIRLCEYSDINDTFKPCFSGAGDDGSYMDDIFRNPKDELITTRRIYDHIKNVIMNSDIHIIEQYKEEY